MRIQEAPWRLNAGEVKPGAGLGLGKTVAKSGIAFRGQITPVEKEHLRRLTEDPRFAESLDIIMQELELLFPQALVYQPSDADRAGGGPAPTVDAEGVEPVRAPTREMVRALMENWHKDLGRLCTEVWEVEKVNTRATAAKDHITRLENDKVHAHKTYMQELTALRDQMRCLERKTPVNFSTSIDDIYFYEPTKYFEDSIKEFVKEIVTYKVRQTLSSGLDEGEGDAQAPAEQLITTIKEKEEEITELKEKIRDMEYETAQDAKSRERRGSVDLDLQFRKAEAEKKERMGALAGEASVSKSKSLRDRLLGSNGGLGRLCRQCGGAVEGAGDEAEHSDRPSSRGSTAEGGNRAGSRRGAGRLGGGNGHHGEGDERQISARGRRGSVVASTQADWHGSSRSSSKAANRRASKGRGTPRGGQPLPRHAQRMLAELAEARGQLRDSREAAAQASGAAAKDLEQRAGQQERRIKDIQQKLHAEFGELENYPELSDCGVNTVGGFSPGAPGGAGQQTLASPRPASNKTSRGGAGSVSHGGGGGGGGAAGSSPGGGGGHSQEAGRRGGSQRSSISVHGPDDSEDAEEGIRRGPSRQTLLMPRQQASSGSFSRISPRSPRAVGGDEVCEAMDAAVKLSEELQQKFNLLSSLVGGDSNVREAVQGLGENIGALAAKLGAVRQKMSFSSHGRTSSLGGNDSSGLGQRYQALLSQLAEMQEKYTQAEFAISELQFKLKEMQQKLRDAGLGELADSIITAVGLREIASAAAEPRNVICVFDRLYRDALARIQRMDRPAHERRAERVAALKSRGPLRQLRGPLRHARRQFGIKDPEGEAAEEEEEEEEDFDDLLDFPIVCPHCSRAIDAGAASSRPPTSYGKLGEASLPDVPFGHFPAPLSPSTVDEKPQSLGSTALGSSAPGGHQPPGGADGGLFAWVQGRSRPGTQAKSRSAQALLTQQDATDWMGPSVSPGALPTGPGVITNPKPQSRGNTVGSPPPGSFQSPPPSRFREALSPRAYASPDRVGQERSLAERPVGRGEAARGGNLGPASRLHESSSADLYFPTSAPVMRPKRSNNGNGSTPSRARQASPRGDNTPLGDRPPSRLSGLRPLPPVLDSGVTRTPVQGGRGGNEVPRPLSSAEGLQGPGGLKHAASAPALTPAGGARGHEAELLPRLERPPAAGASPVLEPKAPVPWAKAGPTTLVPLRETKDGVGEHDNQNRVGVDEEFVTLSGAPVASFKVGGHQKRNPLEDLSRLAAGAQPRPKFLVGGQGFAV